MPWMTSELVSSLILYLVFLFVTYWVCLQIFRLTTYHKYFLKSLPLLIGYSILVGGLMASIQPFHQFWLIQIWGSALLFVFAWRTQAKETQEFFEIIGEDAEERSFVNLSVANTKAYFLLSVLLYLVVYVIAFSWFLNA